VILPALLDTENEEGEGNRQLKEYFDKVPKPNDLKMQI